MPQGNVAMESNSGVMDQNSSAIGAEFDILSPNEMNPAAVPSEVLDELLLAQQFHMIEHVYDALARQLEYYFSPQNLQSDTYLQTLRELNDGCVPVSILANFTKVKAILASLIGFETVESMQKRSNPTQRFIEEEKQRIHAILHVINTFYTYNLQIFSIDTQTGKITDSTNASSSSSNIFSAVGFLSLSAPSEEQTEDAATTYGSNLLVLRYVPAMVTEDEIRSLFGTVSECPTILSVAPDVASSWHVALDTWDRSVLIQVMLQLRVRTYPSCGAPVMVRLYAANMGLLAPAPVLPKKKRKKKKRPKSKKNKASSLSIATTTSTTSTSDPSGDSSVPSPLILTQDHFPSLLRRHSELDKTEWTTTSVEALNDDEEEDEDDDEADEDDDASEESLTKDERYEEEEPKSSSKIGAQHSDTASTATTTSSNASSGFDTSQGSNPTLQKTAVLSGYAAAVRRNSPEFGAAGSSVSEASAPTPLASPTAVPKVVVNSEAMAPDPATAESAWGSRNRLSFVDIVRVNETPKQ